MGWRFVETEDNLEYDVLVNGCLRYVVRRESGVTKNGNVYSEKWVARDTNGMAVDVPERYRADLFDRLKMNG